MPSYLVAFVGPYLLFAGVAFLVWWLWRRRRKSTGKQASTHVAQPTAPVPTVPPTPPVRPIALDHINQQRDPALINAINRVRIGQQNAPDLTLLNARYEPILDPQEGGSYFILAGYSNQVAHINLLRLIAIPSQEQIYTAIVTGLFDCKTYPTDYKLHLKPGAQVMLLHTDAERRWVNGSIGWITTLGPSAIEVRLAAPRHSSAAVVEVKRESWKNIRYQYDPETDTHIEKVIGSFTQFPLKLSWAITVTIHNSQGQTFDKVLTGMDRSGFTDRQT